MEKAKTPKPAEQPERKDALGLPRVEQPKREDDDKPARPLRRMG